jgi:MA3 domain
MQWLAGRRCPPSPPPSRCVHTQNISPEQMQKGFLDVVSSVDDLQIDVPGAVDLTATFVARAVVDDILPPSFVARIPLGAPS